MRRTQRARRDSGPTVSLFPFLAVLLCTMGMLIMLLVAISRDTATGEAAAASPADADPLFSEAAMRGLTEERPVPSETRSAGPEEKLSAEDEKLYAQFREANGEIAPDELEMQRESAEWFLSELKGVRDRTQDELSAERARLAEAEKEINNLVTELVELNQRAADLSRESEPESDSLQKEIDAKAEEIAELNRQIEGLRNKAGEAGEKTTYAILPYRGKTGTFRRPIYVECDENGIRLMPERVQFVPEDFLVAKYPGNPFDAGLRAARQYFIETGEGSSENEPYPLLILKPESAQTYYIAKSALASWGGEFGYEFVESDAEIEYPRPDPELRRRVEEQVAMARARLAGPIAAILNELEANGKQARLIEPDEEPAQGGFSTGTGGDLASQLGPYARLDSPGDGSGAVGGESGEPAGLHHGGAAGEGYGNTDVSDASLGGTAGSMANRIPSAESGGYLSAPSGESYTSEAGISPGGIDAGTQGKSSPNAGTTPLVSDEELLADPAEEMTGGEPAGAETASLETAAAGSGAPMGGMAADTPAGSDEPALPAGEGISGTSAAAESAGSEPIPFAQGDTPYSAPAAETPATPFAELSPSETGEKNGGESIDPRQTVGNTAFLSGNQGETAPSADGADSAVRSGEKPSGTDGTPKEPRVKAERDKREINLAEEFKKPTQTAIERPITVICEEGNVIFPAQAGIRNARQVPLRSDSDQQEILKSIVAIVRGWHAAGRNMYWSPWIRIQTAPEGEETAARLETLMRSQRVRVERINREAP